MYLNNNHQLTEELITSGQSPSCWRLIPMLETSGELQMAIDTWLFHQCENGQHPPTLRFYTWTPHAISLGHLQKVYPDQWDNLYYRGQKLDLVRRPTGGRAVLHQGDLTYAITTPTIPGKSWSVYARICDFLIQGWRNLGIELFYGNAGRGYIHNPSCFSTATAADLVTADGSKFIGSAQRRGKNSVLQHGSMILSADKELYQQIFSQPAPWNTPFCQIQEHNNWVQKIVDSFTQTAESHFNINLITQPISSAEWETIRLIKIAK